MVANIPGKRQPELRLFSNYISNIQQKARTQYNALIIFNTVLHVSALIAPQGELILCSKLLLLCLITELKL
jgi:hypothetical protein